MHPGPVKPIFRILGRAFIEPIILSMSIQFAMGYIWPKTLTILKLTHPTIIWMTQNSTSCRMRMIMRDSNRSIKVWWNSSACYMIVTSVDERVQIMIMVAVMNYHTNSIYSNTVRPGSKRRHKLSRRSWMFSRWCRSRMCKWRFKVIFWMSCSYDCLEYCEHSFCLL